jgi:hypothetical protein
VYDGDDAGVYLGRESAFLAILWPFNDEKPRDEEQTIRACDQQVVELKKIPLDAVTKIAFGF